MEESIYNFPRQFAWNPEMVGAAYKKGIEKYIVVGMGGSHLAADLLSVTHPHLSIAVHKNYGLPFLSQKEIKKTLVILSSYSGNTEEVLDAFKKVRILGLKCAVTAMGGTLLTLAQKYAIPHVQLPDTGIQPRMATGFSLKALLKIMSDEDALKKTSELGETLNAEDFRARGRNIANMIKQRIPVIYASESNFPLAYNSKIKFNETGKVPAFCNMLPELNHNEMTGFSESQSVKKFCFILLKDAADHPRIIKRMNILKRLLLKKGARVKTIDISHKNIWYKIFSTLLIADFAAYHVAKNLGHDPEDVPMVEEFKKMMQ